MTEHKLSYTMPTLMENPSNEEDLLIPQLLLNNPITDPGFSQHVRTYVENIHQVSVIKCSVMEASSTDKEDHNFDESQILSVRKDLWRPSNVQRLSAINMSISKDSTQNLKTPEVITIEENIVKPLSEGQSFNDNTRTRINEENSSVNTLKRRLFSADKRPIVEPPKKSTKYSALTINSSQADGNHLIEKVYRDCQWAQKQDIHGN